MLLKTLETKKKKMLKKIDDMISYTQKLEYLNDEFLKAKTDAEAEMILGMIRQLKFWGA